MPNSDVWCLIYPVLVVNDSQRYQSKSSHVLVKMRGQIAWSEVWNTVSCQSQKWMHLWTMKRTSMMAKINRRISDYKQPFLQGVVYVCVAAILQVYQWHEVGDNQWSAGFVLRNDRCSSPELRYVTNAQWRLSRDIDKWKSVSLHTRRISTSENFHASHLADSVTLLRMNPFPVLFLMISTAILHHFASLAAI